ncbi:VOC family protein [Litchfieldia alkalitelluris]|uniref:VOC family protein n=1 Tax=Litchfieldia alkalitelluris TaxID=304268 RepID=UPI000996B5F7|nr:VOC family protein [Litchfieldia alkalitelluris]
MNFHHIGISTASPDETLYFYSTFFGFEEIKRFMFNNELLIFIAHNGFLLEIVHEPSTKTSPTIHIAWEVEDLQGKIIELENKGLLPIEGPYRIGKMLVVFFKGINGEILELVEKT